MYKQEPQLPVFASSSSRIFRGSGECCILAGFWVNIPQEDPHSSYQGASSFSSCVLGRLRGQYSSVNLKAPAMGHRILQVGHQQVPQVCIMYQKFHHIRGSEPAKSYSFFPSPGIRQDFHRKSFYFSGINPCKNVRHFIKREKKQ